MEGILVLHHGICHTHEHFDSLIAALNSQGFYVAMIDQQSEDAGLFRNCLGLGSYRRGMATAVRAIMERTGEDVRGYVLHSMGAMIGEEMQQANPALRQPTVLMAPIPFHGAWPATWRILLNQPLAYAWAVLTANVHHLASTPQQVRKLFFAEETPEDIIERATVQLRHAPFWTYCRLILRPFVFWRWVANDGNPKLLLYSKSDFLFQEWEFDRTIKLYGDQLEQDKLSGGHDFFIQYASTTAERIADFFARHCGPHIPPPHRRPNRKWDQLGNDDAAGSVQM
jgi:pimeloyl-ACP methyl ester carboxylesterase